MDAALLQDKVKMFYKRFANSLLIAVTEIEVKGNKSNAEFCSDTFTSLLQAVTGIRPWTADFKFETIKKKIESTLGENVSGVDALGDITYSIVVSISSIFSQAEIKVLAEAHQKARQRAIKLLELPIPEKEYSTDVSIDLLELAIALLNQMPMDSYREVLQESRVVLNSLFPAPEEKR